MQYTFHRSGIKLRVRKMLVVLLKFDKNNNNQENINSKDKLNKQSFQYKFVFVVVGNNIKQK